MAKQEPIKQEGEILEALPNAQFRVKLENGHEILAHVSGKMRMYYIKKFYLVTVFQLKCHLMT